MGPLAARSLRIAFLTSTRSWRGSTTVFAELAHGLAARGHRATALVAYDRVAGGFRAQQLSVQTLPVAHTTFTAARALRQALRALESDVVFVDKPRDIRLAAVASLGRRLAVVYCVSTASVPRDPLTRLAFRRVGTIVFLTEQLARRALAEAPFMRRAACRVIPNGVDCGLFRPDDATGHAFRERHGIGDGPLLVAAGALAPEKRWDLLLQSLTLLDPPAPPLVLCGTGPLDGVLRAAARRACLDVRLVGHLERAELAAAFNAATCVVHTCPDEAFSLALAEALACGRPVLAAGGGGVPEVLGDAGVLAPPGDYGAFALLLQDLLRDAARRAALATAARRRAVERYTVERMVHDYAQVLEALG